MATAVFTFGRMNPPTKGHEKLISKVFSISSREGADAYIFVSQTEDNKKNPLSFAEKTKFLKKALGSKKASIQTNKKIRTPFEALEFLLDKDYDRIIFVVGSDRVSEFKRNMGRFVKSEFDNVTFEVESAGERDPDADGVSGISASKMRAFAQDNDFKSFFKGIISGLNNRDAKEVFQLLQKKLGVVESNQESKSSLKSFKQFLSESIIDHERKTFAKKIFDKADTDEPIVKPSVKKYVMSGLSQFDGLGEPQDIQLIGSILTKKYRDDADLDLNVFFKVSDKEKGLEALRKKMAEINGKPVPGTDHPVNYFAVVDKKTFKMASELADAVYDFKTDKHLKKAESKPFDINKYVDDFQGTVGEFDLLQGELIRDLIDLKELENLGKDEINNLKTKVEQKIEEIEIDVEALLSIYSDVKQDRRDIFDTPLTKAELKKYGAKNLLPQNVVYKLLEKYFYFDLIKKVSKIIGDDGEISDKEAEKLAKIDIGKEVK
jgi:hypothetical protein